MGNDREQGLSGLDISAGLDGAVRDIARFRCFDLRVRKIQFSLVNGGLTALNFGGSRLDAGLVQADCASAASSLLRAASTLRVRGAGLRAGEIQLARRNRKTADGLIALVIRLGLPGFGLGGDDIGLFLFNLGLIHRELRIRLFKPALARGEIGAFLIQLGLKIARINLQQHIARLDLLIVLHHQLRDPPGHLRCNRGDMRFDKRVVGGFVRRHIFEIINPGRQTDRQRSRRRRRGGDADCYFWACWFWANCR